MPRLAAVPAIGIVPAAPLATSIPAPTRSPSYNFFNPKIPPIITPAMGTFLAALEKINFDSFPETTFSIFAFILFSAASFPTSFATSPVIFSAVFPTLFSNTFFPALSAATPAPTATNALATRFPTIPLRESNIPLPDSDSGSFSFSPF